MYGCDDLHGPPLALCTVQSSSHGLCVLCALCQELGLRTEHRATTEQVQVTSRESSMDTIIVATMGEGPGVPRASNYTIPFCSTKVQLACAL